MTEASDIEDLLRKHEAFEEAKLAKLIKRAGWGKAAIVAVFASALWVFNLGRAEAEYVRRPELAKALADNTAALEAMKSSVTTLSERVTRAEEQLKGMRDDIHFIREKFDVRGAKP
jgi:hypothetical protein